MRRDDGFTITEMLVTMSLLMVVLTAVYYVVEAIEISNRVTERQAQFARDVTTPLHAMDKILCQNKGVLASGTNISNDYTLTIRTPSTPGSTNFKRYVYAANATGQLTERVFGESMSGTSVLQRQKVWSLANANVSRGKPLFKYYGPSGETTIPAAARSVEIEIWTVNEGKYYSGRRRVFFRNR